jgi:hypothetical protein
MRLTILDDGTIQAIYSDRLTGLLALGETKIERASDVEPADGGWVADMSKSGANVKLGPFPTRQAALDAEVAWLQANRGL